MISTDRLRATSQSATSIQTFEGTRCITKVLYINQYQTNQHDLMSKTSCRMDSDRVAIESIEEIRIPHTLSRTSLPPQTQWFPGIIAVTVQLLPGDRGEYCCPWILEGIDLPVVLRSLTWFATLKLRLQKKTKPCCFVLPWTELKGQLSSVFVVWAFKRVCLRHHNDSLRGHSCNEHAHAKPSAQNTCAGPTQGKRGLGT